MIKIDCDICLEKIYFENGDIWNIPKYEWNEMMDVLLSPNVRDKYYEIDFRGNISQKRYELGKQLYKGIRIKYGMKSGK